MYKVRKKLMPNNILCLFEDRDPNFNLRGEDMFKNPKVLTSVKKNCISVKGVSLWTGLSDELKRSNSIFIFFSTVQIFNSK